MPVRLGDKLVVAISSRALFDLDESHQVYEQEGLEAYRQYQIAREDTPLEPGEAFGLVQKLLRINSMLEGDSRVEVVLLSRNSADTGLRVFNSIQHYGLGITRAAFAGGRSPFQYIPAFGTQLFLSTHAEDVRSTLEAGFAAATILPSNQPREMRDELCCFLTSPSRCSSVTALRLFRPANWPPLVIPWAAGRSRRFSRR
jgi:5'-nucleotidase